MTGGMLLLAIFVLSALGFGLIAISQKQHRGAAGAFGAKAPPVLLRIVGGVLIAASLAAAMLRDGVSFGLLVWATTLTFAALFVVVAVARR